MKMAGKIDKAGILKSNPHIDPKVVERGLDIVRTVEKLGVKKQQYDLAPPCSRQLRADPKTGADPRTVHLGR